MGDIIDNPLRERKFVFTDRHDAGRQLGTLVKTLPGISDPLVLAIPAGGVPVGREVAAALGAPLSLAIVRKIRIPGTTESGFGAVTWDGQVVINEPLRDAFGLLDADVNAAVTQTRENVNARVALFTAGIRCRRWKEKPSSLPMMVLHQGSRCSPHCRQSAGGTLPALLSPSPPRPHRQRSCVPQVRSPGLRKHPFRPDVCGCRCIPEYWYDLEDREVMEELSGHSMNVLPARDERKRSS